MLQPTTKYIPRNYLNAVVIVPDPVQPGKFTGKKYHRIKNSDDKKAKFCKFAKEKFSTALYVNFYWMQSGNFFERIYLE